MSKQNTNIRLEDETRQKINLIAKQKRRKPTELIRMIVEDYVKQFDDVNLDNI